MFVITKEMTQTRVFVARVKPSATQKCQLFDQYYIVAELTLILSMLSPLISLANCGRNQSLMLKTNYALQENEPNLLKNKSKAYYEYFAISQSVFIYSSCTVFLTTTQNLVNLYV